MSEKLEAEIIVRFQEAMQKNFATVLSVKAKRHTARYIENKITGFIAGAIEKELESIIDAKYELVKHEFLDIAKEEAVKLFDREFENMKKNLKVSINRRGW